MDELIIVSVDGHAQMPPELWPEYLEARHHHLLAGLHEDQQRYAEVMQLIFDRAYPDPEVFDGEGVYRSGGWRGLYDTDVRMAEMDREGVAGEFVNTGDGRFVALFFEPSSRAVSADACRSGVRGYHQWANDVLGDHLDRLFLIGSVGHAPCMDLDWTLGELDWIAAKGFRATTLPGKTAYPGDLPLSDPYWEPFWASCADHDLALWIHGGHGQRQGSLAHEVADAYAQYEAAGRDPDHFWEILVTSVFNGELLESPAPRQAMWQIMLSGVFDRYPSLRLNMNEVRGDWIPATIAHLDEVWAANRDELPALRPPSEYWAENCQAGLSFVHRAEVERRHEIGVPTIGFGRDYPHSEGTWPNTADWLRDAFSGVPEDEVRMILGENAIRTFGLDHAELSAIAASVGLPYSDISGPGVVAPELVSHFGDRGGYLKPFEGDRRVPEMVPLVQGDVLDLSGRARAGTSH